MNITINGDAKEIPEALTVSALLLHEKVESPEMVSVQVNEDFIEQDQYATLVLKENDAVDFLYFMGGGSR